jgi:hypothetical protein
VALNARLPTKIFTHRSFIEKTEKRSPGHPNSMQEHKAKAVCRRNGEEILWSHNLSYVFIGTIRGFYHRVGSVARKKDPWASLLREVMGEQER